MSKQNKNLLLISYDFPPSTGGIARLCHEIVTHMHQYYRHIHVITIQKEGVAVPYQDIQEVSVHFLPAQRGKAEFKALQLLKKWPDKENTEVLCGLWHPDAALALLAGMPNVFVLAHGTELLIGNSKFRKYLWQPLYAKWVLGKAKKVIANSSFTESLVRKINPKANTVALPLGVNPSFFKPLSNKKQDGKIKICTVSRVLQFKGHDFILESLESLPYKYREQIEWHIAGTGPYLENLKQLAKSSKLSKQIYFHGFVPDKVLPKFYNQHDLFILATRQADTSTQVEGFGLVFLEAQACGVPVIGTKTGGIPDAIKEGEGGWLIAQDNQKELIALLKKLIDKPELLSKAEKKARERVKTHANWQNYGKKLYTYINT